MQADHNLNGHYVIITDLVLADFRNKFRDYLMNEIVTVWTVNDKSY